MMLRTIPASPVVPVGTVTEGDDWIVTECEPVTLGKTTYRVEVQRLASGSENVTLTGPRGAIYFLRPFMERNGDTGLRQVISYNSGQPLRVKGNEVRVLHIGDQIEVAR